MDADNRITQFVEKPARRGGHRGARPSPRASGRRAELDGEADATSPPWASTSSPPPACERRWTTPCTDFGSEIIPASIESLKVSAYIFDGYWEDIGTIESFYEANIDLASINPDFNLYVENVPIFTNRRDLPPSKINYCTISSPSPPRACIITNANITNSIVGIRTIIETGANLDGVVCMGADFYETRRAEGATTPRPAIPNIGIGRAASSRGRSSTRTRASATTAGIGIDPLPRPDGDTDSYSIRDGIIVIPKGTVLAPGTVI